MLAALVSMCRGTHSIIGAAIVSATVGVRQGSPTSCILFVLFINDLIKLLKENCGWNGFLAPRAGVDGRHGAFVHAEDKLCLLKQFCNNYGMAVNNTKTIFFVVNVGVEESAPFILEKNDGEVVR